MTLNEIRDRCRMIDGHWIWAGATSMGVPRVWAPDFTLHGGKKRTKTGRRAVWHVVTGNPIPNGWRVFGTCREPLCVNPAHIECCQVSERGQRVAASGYLKGRVSRIIASRNAGRKRSKLTPELIATIQSSPKTGRELCEEIGINRQLISKVRQGRMKSFMPLGGLFSGLMRG